MNWQILLVSEVIVQYHPSILRIFHKRILPWKEKRTSPNQTPGTSVLGLPGLLQPPVLLGSPAILLPPLPLRLVFLSQDPASPLSFPELLCLGIASKSWHAWLDRGAKPGGMSWVLSCWNQWKCLLPAWVGKARCSFDLSQGLHGALVLLAWRQIWRCLKQKLWRWEVLL